MNFTFDRPPEAKRKAERVELGGSVGKRFLHRSVFEFRFFFCNSKVEAMKGFLVGTIFFFCNSKAEAMNESLFGWNQKGRKRRLKQETF